MNYQVLARKWRPQQFNEVVGQEHVVQTLKNAISGGRMAHAYLFVGPRGVGKTSIARIFAKALNCEKGPTVTPCDKCDSCKAVSEGRDIDVLEIDGASNTGVDQVRDLRDTVKYAPMRGRFKIYIIDEVHMLSIAAFNALLKTLEEPPEHVKFLFATTEPAKIPPTIISRCQRFDLKRISTPLIVQRLKAITEDEGVNVEQDALIAIARGSEGALRDAESALDQLIAFLPDSGSDKNKKRIITEADVLSVFGLVSRRCLEELAEMILTGNIQGILRTVAMVEESGQDIQRLVFELIEHFRNLLVYKNVGTMEGVMELLEGQDEIIKKQSELSDVERLMRIVNILVDTAERMKYALSRRILLEASLIKCARAVKLVSLEELLKMVNDLKNSLEHTAIQEVKVSEVRENYGNNGDFSVTMEISEAVNRTEDSTHEKKIETKNTIDVKTPEEKDDELTLLREKWKEICGEVARKAVGIGRLLLDAVPVEVTKDKVVISFDSEFKEEMEEFKNGRGYPILKITLKNILGRPVTPMLSVTNISSCTNPKNVIDESASVTEHSQQGKQKIKSKNKDWTKDALVQKVLDTFDGKIIGVRRLE